MAEKSSRANDRIIITFYIPKKLGFLKEWIERDAKKDKLSTSGYLTRMIICTYVGSGRHFPKAINRRELFRRFGKLIGLTDL